MIGQALRHAWVGGLVVVAVVGVVPGSARAQEVARSFEDLQGRVMLGETVRVIDRQGQSTRGKLLRLTATDLTVRTDGGERVVDASNIVEVKARRSGPLLNGALIGAAVGASPFVIFAALDEGSNCDGCMAGALVWMGIGAAAGVGIDALVKGDITVMKLGTGASRGVALVPVIERKRQGLFCSIRF